MARLYALGPEPSGPIATFFIFLINAIPAIAVAVPGYFGIALLAGQLGARLHPVARNLLGIAVLVLGFFYRASDTNGLVLGISKISPSNLRMTETGAAPGGNPRLFVLARFRTRISVVAN